MSSDLMVRALGYFTFMFAVGYLLAKLIRTWRELKAEEKEEDIEWR